MLYEAFFSQDELIRVRDKWIKIALCTDPLDHERIKSVLADAYERAGLPVPEEVIFAGSPLHGSELAVSVAGRERTVETEVLDVPWVLVRNQIRENAPAVVHDQAREMVYESVSSLAYDCKHLGCLWDDKIESLNWRTDGAAGPSFRGQHEPDMSLFSLFEKVPAFHLISPLIELAEISGWSWVFEKTAIVCPRPSRIIWRDETCVHVEFPDGWGVSKLSYLEQLALTSE